MSKIKSYLTFLYESILHASPDFKIILSSIDDDFIADVLLGIVDTDDINTKYNFLNTTDNNRDISFIPDSQAQKKISELGDRKINTLFDIDNNNKTTIGRIAKSILDDNGISNTQDDIEKFVNKFKSAYELSKKLNMKIVKGNDIKKWYSEDNYFKSTKGTLSRSCMADVSSDYFQIYSENPEVCQMVIKLSDEDKLLSRALLWKTNKGIFLDRVYYINDSDEKLFQSWVKSKFPNEEVITREDNYKGVVVKLKPIKIEKFPYIDSIPYYNSIKHELTSYPPENLKGVYFCNNTNGTATLQNSVYSTYERRMVDIDESVYSNRYGYLTKSECVYSEKSQAWIPKGESVYSKNLSSYLDRVFSVEVITNLEKKMVDYYDKGSTEIGRDSISDRYYLKEFLDEVNGYSYLKGSYIKIYTTTNKVKYEKIFKTRKYKLSELDSEVFGLKISDNFEAFRKEEYYNIFINIDYDEIINIVKKSKSGKKDEKLKELEKINSYLEKESNTYKFNRKLKSMYSSFDDLQKDFDKYLERFKESKAFYKYNHNPQDGNKILLDEVYKYLMGILLILLINCISVGSWYDRSWVNYVNTLLKRKFDVDYNSMVIAYFISKSHDLYEDFIKTTPKNKWFLFKNIKNKGDESSNYIYDYY